MGELLPVLCASIADPTMQSELDHGRPGQPSIDGVRQESRDVLTREDDSSEKSGDNVMRHSMDRLSPVSPI